MGTIASHCICAKVGPSETRRDTEEQTGGGEMPFWKKDNDSNKPKEKINYKKRFEHKQYLAQESPEPVYDLIDCALKNAPAGVFSRCKVLRKEALLLQENDLSSLSGGGSFSDLSELQVLDLHKNSLEKITEDVGHLVNLRALYMQENKLKQLPNSIGSLKNLQTLNISGNSLKELPLSISGLVCLKTLDVRNNPKLKRIPKELAHIRCLETLLLDEKHINYPDPEIVSKGTEAIMRFLCSECQIDYISPSQCLPSVIEINGKENGVKQALIDPYEDLIKGHLEKEEKKKEEKKQQAIMLERQMVEIQENEAELKRQSVKHKKKLLDNLAEEETKMEAEMMKYQRIRDDERKLLNEKMNQAEQQSDFLIKELMDSNMRYSDPAKMMEALEADKKQLEDQFKIVNGDIEKLKETEVLRAMQMMMEEELQKKATIKLYEERQGVIRSALTSTLENDKAVEEVLSSKGKQQTELISKMLEDEKYQREAFQALLVQQDHRALEITDQMSMIQNELAALTVVEMKKRDMKVEFEMELMGEKRETLTKLLLDLMEKKQNRANDLQRIMGEMETGREKEQENYWLIQYQKLLDSKPKGLEDAETNLDTKVKDLLKSCGGDEYLPLFAKKQISMKELLYMEDKDLKELGVSSEYIRKKIKAGVDEYHAMGERMKAKFSGIEKGLSESPSAPPTEMDELAPTAPTLPSTEDVPSAPPIETFQSAECVVCMERKCDIIFLPCGHLCSCSQCDRDLAQCPLCRTTIVQRVKL
eukprot:GFUD01031025.1.p1 GENE.GFUD01031025.1~~GFUD01031025.1.p1  ORF type:complete len:761 (-),score=260.52 GFUD01031025.1:320-2602(-)